MKVKILIITIILNYLNLLFAQNQIDNMQFDNEYLYAATEQGELAEITITFDETLIGINGNYSFSATDPISEFDISMQMLGQTFGRETDIDGDVIGAPYFNVRNYHTPGATTFALEWVISEIDLPEGIPLFEDGSLGANFSDIIEPSIVSLVLYDNGAFQVNNPTVTTGNRYNVGIDLVVTAVPVPATAWMFVTALAGLAGVSSRRRMKP